MPFLLPTFSPEKELFVAYFVGLIGGGLEVGLEDNAVVLSFLLLLLLP
jgi:hypothetical protein